MCRCHLLPTLFTLAVLTVGLGLSYASAATAILPCRDPERKALLELKRLLLDPSHRLSSWVGDDCCSSWEGVGCSNTTGHVIRLDLRSSNTLGICDSDDLDFRCKEKQALGGDIIPSLLSLRYLSYLDLSGNYFGGPIPAFFGSLRRLTYLNLSSAGFIGPVPHQLGNLSNLRYLDLSFNLFYDADDDDENTYHYLYIEHPGWISQLTSLRVISMSGASFGRTSGWLQALNKLPHIQEVHFVDCHLGAFSRSLPQANFTQLTTLNLRDNGINSTAPDWLFNITALKYLDIGGNYIHWSVPASFEKLTNLEMLDLSKNVLRNGFLRQGALSNLCKLQSLHLQDAVIDDVLSNIEVVFFGCLMHSLEELNLGNTQLRGSLPYLLGNMKNLRYLNLSHNSLFGSLPVSLGNISSLRYLDLNSNYLNGTVGEGIGQLRLLAYLDLGNNMLSLSESQVANLSSLKYWDISHNSLVLQEKDNEWIPSFQLQTLHMDFCQIFPKPRFPEWLRTQKYLKELYLEGVGINGTVPGWLPSGLKKLYLSHNQIIGDIPQYFPDLTDLSLSNNSFSGHVPMRMASSFPRLEHLDLSYNKFTGEAPSNFSKLRYLDLSDNLFSGDLHARMGNMMPHLRYLFLSNNKITGDVPQYFPNLLALDASNNLLSGHLPPRISQKMPKLYWLDLALNSLSGNIPLSLCESKFWSIIRLYSNNLSGEIPDCWKNSSAPFFLDFSSNQLHGRIPDTICNLQTLQSLHLSRNKLSGQVPLCFQKLSSLFTLDLGYNSFSGHISAWVGESFTNLKTLSLRSNAFTGSIPHLSHLQSLQVLDISNNQLCCSIPQSIGNLSAMKSPSKGHSYFNGDDSYDDMWLFIKGSDREYINLLVYITVIDLSNNKLSGNIPEEIENLSELQSLNLSGNCLTGKVPLNIDRNRRLEIIDLSRNNLSGAIPSSLAALNFLSHLNLSHNNFSGKIPTGNQLQTFTDPSIYAGNRELCGPPLTKSCTEVETGSVGRGEEDGASRTETIWLYASGALGFIAGFWMFSGTLLLHQRWRTLYFWAIDNAEHWITTMLRADI